MRNVYQQHTFHTFTQTIYAYIWISLFLFSIYLFHLWSSSLLSPTTIHQPKPHTLAHRLLRLRLHLGECVSLAGDVAGSAATRLYSQALGQRQDREEGVHQVWCAHYDGVHQREATARQACCGQCEYEPHICGYHLEFRINGTTGLIVAEHQQRRSAVVQTSALTIDRGGIWRCRRCGRKSSRGLQSVWLGDQ